jgi:hypothetical protein
MARRPARWAAWVDRENDYWQTKGMISPAGAERMKRWEKSWVLKWLAAATVIFGLVGLVITTTMLIRVLLAEHAKLRQPFDPKWYLRPPVKPKVPGAKPPPGKYH